MKKLLLVSAVILSSQAFAASWGHLSFPTSKPYYTATSAYDINDLIKINFACAKEFKHTLVISMDNLNLKEKTGVVKITESAKDKKSVNIIGEFETATDGAINLIFPEKSKDLLKTFKSLHGMNLSFEKDGKVIEVVRYNLKGSSVAINKFENRCKKL